MTRHFPTGVAPAPINESGVTPDRRAGCFSIWPNGSADCYDSVPGLPICAGRDQLGRKTGRHDRGGYTHSSSMQSF